MSDFDGKHELIDAAEQLKVLDKFEQSRQTIRLRVSGAEQSFSTVILFCDRDRRELVLDQAPGSDGQLDWEQYSFVNLDGTAGGIHYQFINLAVRNRNNEDGVGHRVAFPQRIIYQQRRQAYRCPVPRAVTSRLTIRFENNKQRLQGRILDFSATGLACECQIPISDAGINCRSDIGDNVSLEIQLSELLTVICPAEIKAILMPGQRKLLRLGLEFSNLSPSVQRKIDKAAADLQRLTRTNQID